MADDGSHVATVNHRCRGNHVDPEPSLWGARTVHGLSGIGIIPPNKI